MPTHFQGTPEEILALNTFIKLSRAASSLDDRIMEHGSLGKLTTSQFGVLEALYHLGPLCQGELSQKLLKSTGNMTMVVDNLEKLSLVKRVRSTEDRRMIRIELTQAGKTLIEAVLPVHVAAIVAEMRVLTPDEQGMLGELLRKLGRGGTGMDTRLSPVEVLPIKPANQPSQDVEGNEPVE